jgi:FixJ family two-component response regulator
MNLGAVDFITKPFNPLLVKAKIETQINLMECFSIIKKLDKHLDTIKASDPDLFDEVNELLEIH